MEEQPKIYLQNKLVRSRGKLAEVDAVVDAKRREAQKLRDLVGAYSADHSLGNIDDISDVRACFLSSPSSSCCASLHLHPHLYLSVPLFTSV